MLLAQPLMIHTFILSVDVIRSILHDSHIHTGVYMLLGQPYMINT